MGYRAPGRGMRQVCGRLEIPAMRIYCCALASLYRPSARASGAKLPQCGKERTAQSKGAVNAGHGRDAETDVRNMTNFRSPCSLLFSGGGAQTSTLQSRHLSGSAPLSGSKCSCPKSKLALLLKQPKSGPSSSGNHQTCSACTTSTGRRSSWFRKNSCAP